MLPAANAHTCSWVHKQNLQSLASFPRPRPAFHCLQYVLPATEIWARAWEQDYSFSTQSESESCLPMITGLVRSDESFCCGSIPPYICSYYTCTKSKWRAIYHLTENACSSNYWNSVWQELQKVWDLGPKNCDLLASKINKIFLGEHTSRPP